MRTTIHNTRRLKTRAKIEASSMSRPFISHAYRDIEARTAFLRQVPSDSDPYFFTPITVRPDELVSTSLIRAVLDCDSLIYFDGGFSDESFWVAFERDFACRVGKPIFRFDTVSGELSRVTLTPMHLPAFPAFRSTDFTVVARLLEIMRQERNFDLFVPQLDITDQDRWNAVSEREIYKTLTQGGYVVVFWSRNAAQSKRIAGIVEKAYGFLPAEDPNDQRLLFALLDSTPLPGWYTKYLTARSASGVLPIQPVRLIADQQFSLLNRLDDLIVRLYWLIWRKRYAI